MCAYTHTDTHTHIHTQTHSSSLTHKPHKASLGGGVPYVVCGTGHIYARVRTTSVETHLLCAALYPLLQAFIDI